MNSMIRLLVLNVLFVYPTLASGGDPPKSDTPAKPASESSATKPDQKPDSPPAKPQESGAAQDKAAQSDESVRVISAAELGLRRKGKFAPRYVGREVAQFNRLLLRIEAGIDLTPEQKAEIRDLFETAKRDVRTDRIDPTLVDSSPERGLEIPESGGLPKRKIPPAPATGEASTSSQPSDGKTADPAKSVTPGKTPESPAKTAEKSGDPKNEKKDEQVDRKPDKRRVVISVPEDNFEPVVLGDYVYTLADLIREILDEKQRPKFETIFDRWSILHPQGGFDGPFPRLARTIRDPLIGLPDEKRRELIKIIAVTRKDAQKDDPDEVRAKRAEDAKAKILAQLTDDQRRLFLSTLAELEVDDEMALREKEEYKKGVPVGR